MTSNLGIARSNLKSLVIRAPLAGQLTMLKASAGESIAKGQRVGQIDEIDRFKVSALVDEFYLGRLAIGQTASVQIAAERYELTVTKVYPEVRTRQFEVDLAFKSNPKVARLGQTLQMTLNSGGSEESLLVDYGAFFEDTGGRWVYVLARNGKSAVRREVTLGRQDSRLVQVVDGLSSGETVITSSYGSHAEAETIQLQ